MLPFARSESMTAFRFLPPSLHIRSAQFNHKAMAFIAGDAVSIHRWESHFISTSRPTIENGTSCSPKGAFFYILLARSNLPYLPDLIWKYPTLHDDALGAAVRVGDTEEISACHFELNVCFGV